MEHRHLVSDVGWTKAAIDSVLERGDLADWRRLFAAARADRNIAQAIMDVATHHHMRGVLPIVEHLVKRTHSTVTTPPRETSGR
jgi:hypothetical protein